MRRVLSSPRYPLLASGIVLVVWAMTSSFGSPIFQSLKPLVPFPFDSDIELQRLFSANESDVQAPQDTLTLSKVPAKLGIASHIYMISLPGRQDRRSKMEVLRSSMQLEWTYVDAIHHENPIISKIIDHVRTQRKMTSLGGFRWPPGINPASMSARPLGIDGSDLWTQLVKEKRIKTKAALTHSSEESGAGIFPFQSNLACATEDYTVAPFSRGIPPHMILSSPKVACWYSHISAIRRFVDEDAKYDDVAIFLEDDVDMERDIQERLESVWDALPAGWDIVFLGHCWSNESFYPQLSSPRHGVSLNTTSTLIYPPNTRTTRLHHSCAPKCTHAYALSLSGARRVLLHLRYAPFAYSRALDQALSWLVESGRLRSYSVVPSVVIQRKVDGSDVMEGLGSAWREGLVFGVFGS